MTFDPILADIRFGAGLSPVYPPPVDAAAMLARLAGPDNTAAALPIPTFAAARPTERELRAANRAYNTAETEAAKEEARRARQQVRNRTRDLRVATMYATVLRGALGEDPFRERLVAFWADHFTISGKGGVTRHLITPYVEEAIRPNVTARFADLLRAAALHPLMVVYLDGHRSFGPNSERGRDRGHGLNENLAREVLELHTLGVGTGYDQSDVREFAELLTGLEVHPRRGFGFREDWSEPGAETVLGRSYAGETLEAIERALDDLAVHPATARHIAGKLAVHFVADEPDADLVDHVAAAFRATDGDLMAVYAALLEHPAAWTPELRKVKRPQEFIQSAVRALSPDARRLQAFGRREINSHFGQDLDRMGQDWERPVGPDGWPEEAEAWVTPQGMPARIEWAMKTPAQLVADLPDPREFVYTALGPAPPGPVLFAAQAAESRDDGIGLILASAAFQRR